MKTIFALLALTLIHTSFAQMFNKQFTIVGSSSSKITKAIRRIGSPLVLESSNGSDFVLKGYTNRCEKRGDSPFLCSQTKSNRRESQVLKWITQVLNKTDLRAFHYRDIGGKPYKLRSRDKKNYVVVLNN